MKKASQSQIAYEYFKEMIINRELLPGQQIVETSFAEKLGISRTPMREAIRALEKDGLVNIIPNKGTYIVHFGKEEIIMGLEVAEALEGMVAFLVAERVIKDELTKDDFVPIEDLIQEMDEYLDQEDYKEWSVRDEELHDSLAELSGNTILIDALKRIKMQLNSVLWFVTPIHIDKNVSNECHKRIFDAIKKGDMYKARAEAQDHRFTVRNELLKIF